MTKMQQLELEEFYKSLTNLYNEVDGFMSYVVNRIEGLRNQFHGIFKYDEKERGSRVYWVLRYFDAICFLCQSDCREVVAKFAEIHNITKILTEV